MSVLDKIVQQKKQEITVNSRLKPLSTLLAEINEKEKRPVRSLLPRMKSASQFHLICEIKKASPSAGDINTRIQPLQQALAYQKGGASAVSILTDGAFFKGDPATIEEVRPSIHIPILRKDFIIDAYQIYESRYIGADIILLIARILDRHQIEEFVPLAHELQLEVLFEIYDEEDIPKIPLSAPNLILGINNRNLDTLEVDMQHSLLLKEKIADQYPLIAESGISSVTQCQQFRAAGFSGALIGEALMKSPHPEETVRNFVKKLWETHEHPA